MEKRVKKILLVTCYFHPESFKCNDVAFELQKRGYDVTVMTAIPNYPKGKFFDGYGIFKKRKEVINGVKVYRSLVIPRGNGGALGLVLNYASYTFFASLQALRLGLTKRYDAIIVNQLSPVTVGIPAFIVRKLRNIPMHFWVLDLWPESLTAAAGITNKYVLGFFDWLTKKFYTESKSILISSKGFRKSISAKGDFDAKIHYFPNWVEDALNNRSDKAGETQIPDFPNGFNVVMAGNMGDAQDLPHVLETAKILKGKGINFIFIGDGRRREYVENFVKNNGLTQQVICTGRYPLELMPFLFAKADVLFFSLKDEPIFALTAPARLQAYMSAGKPIVAMINGDGADIIRESDCGWSASAESSQDLADLLLNIKDLSTDELKSKGMNGKRFCEENFDMRKCIDHLEFILNT